MLSSGSEIAELSNKLRKTGQLDQLVTPLVTSSHGCVRLQTVQQIVFFPALLRVRRTF